ncbi:MAG: hypothetical protein QM723_39340 [Myxococcaceae bacterium]
MSPPRFLALALSLSAAAALASVVKAETFQQSVDATPVIVRARIGQVQTVRDEGRIWTFAEVEVLEKLKGNPTAHFIVRQSGGSYRDRTIEVSGAPKFESGEETVLFLEVARDDPSMLLVHALAAGKYNFENDRFGKPRVFRHLNGLAFAAAGDKTIQRVGTEEDDGTPQEFLARLKKAIAGGAK